MKAWVVPWCTGAIVAGGCAAVLAAWLSVGLVGSIAAGLFVGFVVISFVLWVRGHDARTYGLGTGLLGGLVVALAVGFAQVAIDQQFDEFQREQERRDDIEDARTQARLQRIQQRQTLLTMINLQRDLSSIDLAGEDLKKLYLRRKLLRRASLHGAKMDEVNLRGAVLQRANLSRASLVGADLTKADLVGANLCKADLTDADLFKADLWRADLEGATIDNAQLRLADLRNADLRVEAGGHGLRRTDLEGAKYDWLTTRPDRFNPRKNEMDVATPREPAPILNSRRPRQFRTGQSRTGCR